MTQHYFSETPAGDFTPREIEVTLGGGTHRLLTAGGVFSPEQLDRGTAILLKFLDSEAGEDSPTHLLDIGCGWGAIALSAALRSPSATVWAVDVNERSRTLTRMNAERLGLENVRVCAPDEVPQELVFAQIHSNPPIRVGKEVLHDILSAWLPRLAPGGTATLVVAKHLGADSLQRWISETRAELDVWRVARDKGFHLIRAVRGE